MSNAYIPLFLYLLLLITAAFAPLRVAIGAYLTLSVVDFLATDQTVGVLNTFRGLILPAYLLWRLRDQAGHRKTVLAPIAFLLFTAYVAVGGFWSLFPLAAFKLVFQLMGSFLICLVMMRATKGGYLAPKIVLPVAIGVLAVGLIRTFFGPIYFEPDRFSGYISAQAYASFCAAIFCTALCSRMMRTGVRVTLCVAMAITIVFDGSRIWLIGLCISSMVTLLSSKARGWIKLTAVGVAIIIAAGIAGSTEFVLGIVEHRARDNRIAAAITAIYKGDTRGRGLGTYNLRREIDDRAFEMLRDSSVLELILGHGTSNGAMITWSITKAGSDPNRAVHNEWIRILYEWGVLGLLLWLTFVGSLIVYAFNGMKEDRNGFAQPLFAYTPAFLIGISGENILAGAGGAVNLGLLMLIGFASIAHREAEWYSAVRSVQARMAKLAERARVRRRFAASGLPASSGATS